MSSLSVFRRPERIEMTDNQVLTLKSRQLEITCLSGLLWITDGVGGDRIVQEGQQVTLRSKSSICIQAFAPSVVRIRPAAPAGQERRSDMIDPYTMQRLNAERLKDLDREAAGLCFSRLARPNRRRALNAARLRLAGILIAAGERIRPSADHRSPQLSDLLK